MTASASNQIAMTISARLELELVSYDHVPQIASGHFNVINYWQEAAETTSERDRVVVNFPTLPLLSTLAGVFLSIDGTSCETERTSQHWRPHLGI